MPTIVEGLIHVSIGIVIYIVFNYLSLLQALYYLAFVPLTIIFIVMYPFLIAIAQRSLFKFSWNAYALWMEAHILFMILMAISIPTIAKTLIIKRPRSYLFWTFLIYYYSSSPCLSYLVTMPS